MDGSFGEYNEKVLGLIGIKRRRGANCPKPAGMNTPAIRAKMDAFFADEEAVKTMMQELNDRAALRAKEDPTFIPESMKADAFMCLTLALLRESWMSSDIKVLIFHGMRHNMKELGYSEDEMEDFNEALAKVTEKLLVKNSFMG